MSRDDAMSEVNAVIDYACDIADTQEDRERIMAAFEIVLAPFKRVGDCEIMTCVSREDIASLRDSDDRPMFDADAVAKMPQAALAKIASRMAEAFIETGGYWDMLEDLAEARGVAKAAYD